MDKITSRGAREARLRAMPLGDLHWKGKQHDLNPPSVMDLTSNPGFVTRLIHQILDKEFGPAEKPQCHCGLPGKLYTVHVPVEDGSGCFPYSPEPQGVIEGNIITQSPPSLMDEMAKVFQESFPKPAVVSKTTTHALGGTETARLFAIDGPKVKTESGRYIVEQIVPEVLEHFLSKNADYGDQHRFGLGPRAEYVGMHRKMYKLKKALWEGQEMNHEGVREMVKDLIGSGLLILDLLDIEGGE